MIFKYYIVLLRPVQWIKNLILFFPPFLGGQIGSIDLIGTALLPFVSFCFASSATYIFNDIRDVERDKFHQAKKVRPLASGLVSPRKASVLSFLLFSVALVSGAFVSPLFVALLASYCVISISYSYRLKSIPVLDLFCISSGFLLRLYAGGEAFGVVISDWLFLTVFLLSLFLSTGKRLCEKIVLRGGAGDHRAVLDNYPDGLLDGIMYMTGAAVLVTYTMYVVARPSLVYTVPICCFGLLRYILRVKSGTGGDPTQSLLKDPALFCTGLVWALMVGWSIYQ